MAVAVSYPGVYIEEIPSGVRTITGVATSIGAFVDFFRMGPMNEAVQVFSFADVESNFGGLDARSEASYALRQFFLNGGSEAYVVRVMSGTSANQAAAAAIALENQVGGSSLLTVTAADPGAWGNYVRLDVDYNTTAPTTLFNLTVTEISSSGGSSSVVATEKYQNVVIDPTQSNDVAAMVNSASQLIGISESGTTGERPAQTGTASEAIALSGSTLVAVGTNTPLGLSTTDTMEVALGTNALGTTASLGTVPTTLSGLASTLQTLIRGIQVSGSAALPNATVAIAGSASTQASVNCKVRYRESGGLRRPVGLRDRLGE